MAKNGTSRKLESERRLRSQLWFDNPDNPGMTALYLERYLNYGLSRDELTSGKPIIGIAQTGSDLSPCNRHHLELAQRVREGIRTAGGIAFEFPVHPIQETGKRPTAALDRNLAYLGLVEVLFGYPLDGVVLMTGCDKTTPACLMAAATVNTPAIVLSGGPMLDGYHDGKLAGSGTVLWQARQDVAAGKIDYKEFIDIAASSAPSIGHCNTMGTASTMNAMAEALGMSLPGCAAIPAPYRERAQIAYETGLRAVEIVREDLKPSDILTRAAFENAIVACSAIGGSTNAPIHLNAIARHVGVGSTSRTGKRSATTCRSSSTCSRPANISARNIIAPAACRRCCTNCTPRSGSMATRSPSTARPLPRTWRGRKPTTPRSSGPTTSR